MPIRPSRIGLIILVLAVLALIGLKFWSDRGKSAGEAAMRAEATSKGESGKPAGSPWQGPRRSLRDAALTDDGGENRLKPNIDLSVLFQSDCSFGVKEHCEEWRLLAEVCDQGKADACVELGEMLIQQAPMQPVSGFLFLGSACELGRDDMCQKALDWKRWSIFGYTNRWDVDEPVPKALQEECDSGNHVACGLIQMRLAKLGQLDEETAMASCRAGFPDVCRTLAQKAPNTSVAIAALKAGCDIPDAALCFYLGLLYRSECQDLNHESPCPKPDAERAASYHTLACELDPELYYCGTP